MAREDRAVLRRQQPLVAQFDCVLKIPRQLSEKPIESPEEIGRLHPRISREWRELENERPVWSRKLKENGVSCSSTKRSTDMKSGLGAAEFGGPMVVDVTAAGAFAQALNPSGSCSA